MELLANHPGQEPTFGKWAESGELFFINDTQSCQDCPLHFLSITFQYWLY